MNHFAISVIKVRDVLIVSMPPDPDDSTVAEIQDSVLDAMERHAAKALILDLSPVETLDSYFARTVSETAGMVTLMGGRTVLVGMRPAVAVTATEMGLNLGNLETALSTDRALDLIAAPAPPAGRGRG